MAGAITGATNITSNGVITATGPDDAGAMTIERLDASANSDTVGTFSYRGKDSAGNGTQYSRIKTEIVNNIDGAESGKIEFSIMGAGTSSESVEIDVDGINLLGSRTIRFGGADKFRILTTQGSSSVATSSSNSDGRIKIEIDGTQYYIPIYNA